MASALEHTETTAHVCIQPADTPNKRHPVPHHSPPTSVIAHPSSLTIDDAVAKFDCKICFDVCRDPVVTMCGHLFCWPCLYCWLSLHSISKECPVCKADAQHKIIPLYGCGNAASSTDSLAEKIHGIRIPCRPSATTSIAPSSTPAMYSQEYNPNHAIQNDEMDRISAGQSTPSTHLGFLITAFRRLGFACLHPHSSLGSRARNAASSLVQQRRFSNKKEFVLQWAFIFTAGVAISFFLLC